jgi:hypothetical protein
MAGEMPGGYIPLARDGENEVSSEISRLNRPNGVH